MPDADYDSYYPYYEANEYGSYQSPKYPDSYSGKGFRNDCPKDSDKVETEDELLSKYSRHFGSRLPGNELKRKFDGGSYDPKIRIGNVKRYGGYFVSPDLELKLDSLIQNGFGYDHKL